MPEVNTNFSVSTVATAPSPATSGTSLTVASGHGTRFPDPAVSNFNCVVCPADAQPTPANAEIVRVTAKSTDTFTITRTQESTSARSIVVGDRIYAGVTAAKYIDNGDLFISAATRQALSTIDAKGDLYAGTGNDATDNLPVGSNNQVLAADSSQSMGLKWTSNFDAKRGHSGVLAPMMPGGGYQCNTGALTASRMYANRFQLTSDMSLSQIAFVVGTAAGAADAFDVGIYTFSGSTLTRVASSGAITSATSGGGLGTTGVKRVDVAASLTAGTVYYAAFSVGTFGGSAASVWVAAGVIVGGWDIFGTALGDTIACFKASAHPLGSSVGSMSTGLANTPILALYA